MFSVSWNGMPYLFSVHLAEEPDVGLYYELEVQEVTVSGDVREVEDFTLPGIEEVLQEISKFQQEVWECGDPPDMRSDLEGLCTLHTARLYGRQIQDVSEKRAHRTIDCPLHIQESLRRYRDERVPTGGFLRSVLEGELYSACNRADLENRRCIVAIAEFIYREFPVQIYGTPEAVEKHLKEKP